MGAPAPDPPGVLDRATAGAWRWTSRLLATEPVFEAVQRALSFTLSARRVVDRVLETTWAAAQVPSYADVERLQAELADTRARLERAELRLAARARRADTRHDEV